MHLLNLKHNDKKIINGRLCAINKRFTEFKKLCSVKLEEPFIYTDEHNIVNKMEYFIVRIDKLQDVK